MTTKGLFWRGLFWMFLGPALWTAVLLWTATDRAHGMVQPAGNSYSMTLSR